MIEELLPFYEKQLQEFAQQSREFAQKYPKIAQRLALNQEQIDDPHIERLIQAFALIAARVDKKLVDSYDIFTHALFEVMFPQYLKHFPSCTVLSFDDSRKPLQLQKQQPQHSVQTIAKHSALKSKSIKGVQCEFRNSAEVRLLPIQLKHLSFKANPSSHIHLHQNATLSMGFEIADQAHALLSQEKLPIYLDAISNFPLQLLDSIFKAETRFSLSAASQQIEIDNPFDVMGFQEADCVLPIDQHTHHAYRLLLEYFCFPERFNYLNLDLAVIQQLNSAVQYFEIQIHLKLNLNDQALIRNYAELNIANFKLFTSPAVNLFEKHAEPQKINHRQLEYPLVTDAHHPEFYQVYTVLNMQLVREKTNQEQVRYSIYPFFAMSHYHGEEIKFFYALNSTQQQHRSMATRYSIISKDLTPYRYQADFVSIRLLCSNRDLPHEALKQSNHILNLNDRNMARRALILKRPTASYVFDQNKQEQWRIISHLSLNTLSLMKGDALSHVKELLALYNLPKSKENQRIIDAIKSVEFDLTHKLLDAKPFPICVRGLRVKLHIDAQVFRGHSLYLFSQLLSHLFNLKVHINSFVDVLIMDSVSLQELYRCVQNVGGKTLL